MCNVWFKKNQAYRGSVEPSERTRRQAPLLIRPLVLRRSMNYQSMAVGQGISHSAWGGVLGFGFEPFSLCVHIYFFKISLSLRTSIEVRHH